MNKFSSLIAILSVTVVLGATLDYSDQFFTLVYAVPTHPLQIQYDIYSKSIEENIIKCANGKVEFVKFSYVPNVNCVYPDTATKLEQRGWGLEPPKMYERNKAILNDNLEDLDDYLFGTNYEVNKMVDMKGFAEHYSAYPRIEDNTIGYKLLRVDNATGLIFMALSYTEYTYTDYYGVFSESEKLLYNNANTLLIDFFKQKDVIVPILIDIKYLNYENYAGCSIDYPCERLDVGHGYETCATHNHLGDCISTFDLECNTIIDKVRYCEVDPDYRGSTLDPLFDPKYKCETKEEQETQICSTRESLGIQYYCDGELDAKCLVQYNHLSD